MNTRQFNGPTSGSQQQHNFISNNLSTITQLLTIIECGIPHIFIEDFIRCEQMKMHTINNQQLTLTINLNLEIRILAQNQQYFIVKTHVKTETEYLGNLLHGQ